LYREKGLDHLNVFNYKPKKQLLTDAQIAELVVWIKSISPQTLKEITCYIKEKFNVHYSLSGAKKLLNRNGIKLLRPRTIPGGAPSVDVQKKYVETYKNKRDSASPGTNFFLLMECT